MRAKSDWLALVVPAAGAAAAIFLVAVPLAMLIYAAFRGPVDFLPFEPGAQWTLDNVRHVFTDPIMYGEIIPDTLTFVAGTVILSVLMALAMAWLLERTDLAHRGLWFALIIFPTLVPIVVKGIAWILLMSPNAGWVNQLIRGVTGYGGKGPINVFSMPGLIFCQALSVAPFVFLQFIAALRSMNPALEEASRASGASSWTTTRRITLPVLLPGLLAPVILVTLITFEQFELPLIIGLPGGINVFAYRIYNELNPASGLPSYGRAAAISLPFLAMGLIALVAYNRAIRHAEKFVTVTGKAYIQRRIPLGRWRWPAYGFLGLYAAFAAILPAVILVWTSLFGLSPPGSVALERVSLAAYRQFIGGPGGLDRGAQLVPCCDALRLDHHHAGRPDRLDRGALAAARALAARRTVLYVPRDPRRHREPRRDGSLSLGPDRTLRHGVDPGDRLFVSPCRIDTGCRAPRSCRYTASWKKPRTRRARAG